MFLSINTSKVASALLQLDYIHLNYFYFLTIAHKTTKNNHTQYLYENLQECTQGEQWLVDIYMHASHFKIQQIVRQIVTFLFSVSIHERSICLNLHELFWTNGLILNILISTSQSFTVNLNFITPIIKMYFICL